MTLSPQRIEVVEIHSEEQKAQAKALLDEGFRDSGIDWGLAFQAPPGQIGHGVMLLAGGIPRGVILCFEKREIIGGVDRRIVNFSSWYIKPEYRKHILRMESHITSDPEGVFTGFTAIPSVCAAAIRFGFRYISYGSIVSMPLLNGFKSNGIGAEPYSGEGVDPVENRWISDHQNERTIVHQITDGEITTPVVWTRGLKVGELSAVRLLYTGNYQLLARALPAIHSYLLFKHRIPFVYLPNIDSLSEVKSFRGEGKGPSIIAKGKIEPEEINLLYSELHYLPISSPSFRNRVRRALKKIKRLTIGKLRP